MDLNVLLERANLLMEQGRYADAELQIKQALEQEPQSTRALSLLAQCYLNTKRYNLGIEITQRAVAAEPNNSFYFYLLGFGYHHKNLQPQAQQALEQAIGLNPWQAEYFGLLGYVLISRRKFEEGLKKADEGLALEADNLTCLNARSTALNKLKQTDAAVDTMNTALAQDPNNVTTHNTVGWNLLERGRAEEASAHFMEALRINPDSGTAQSGLKESLKSKLLLYKWLLQYSFWVSNKGKKYGVAVPIALYILFRLLTKAAGANQNTAGYAWILAAVYILFVVVTWTIGSIANFTLLFHPLGKHALTHSEKRSAVTVVSALALALLIAVVGFILPLSHTSPYAEYAIFPVIICLSLALPLGTVEYPLRWQGKKWRERYAVALIGLGAAALLLYAASPSAALPLMAVYGVAFMIYNWAGLAA